MGLGWGRGRDGWGRSRDGLGAGFGRGWDGVGTGLGTRLLHICVYIYTCICTHIISYYVYIVAYSLTLSYVLLYNPINPMESHEKATII